MKKSFVGRVARIAALGSVVAAAQLVAPAGNAVVFSSGEYPDTVRTVTTLHLDVNLAQYGRLTGAAVTVKPTGNASGTPRGRVRLVIAGVTTLVGNLSRGHAYFTLPRRALTAQHTYGIRATYLRSSGSRFKESKSAIKYYTVGKANTRAGADVPDIRRGQRPRVDAMVHSSTGLTPNGRVRVSLIKDGRVRRTQSESLRAGGAVLRFASVRQVGRWTAKVTYLGTRNFNSDSGSYTFRVTRR